MILDEGQLRVELGRGREPRSRAICSTGILLRLSSSKPHGCWQGCPCCTENNPFSWAGITRRTVIYALASLGWVWYKASRSVKVRQGNDRASAVDIAPLLATSTQGGIFSTLSREHACL